MIFMIKCQRKLIMNEILSPAGTIESFYAAISNGCDAIYLGLDKFNARAYANNFTIDNLKDLVEYAHLRNVKIYVTMNTIVYDYELSEIYKTIDELASIHVDALIIQDLAILNYVTNTYKSLEAHASTQMGIDDLDGAALLKDLGVKRVVFARETPLSAMKEIKDKLNIEIEAFIHGALCVAYSGNCLMSSMIGERSGNRGRCAGCCRQPYSLINLDDNSTIKYGYLLSTKDLNVSSKIQDMDFVDSLKIEGRMKEPNYVASVTNYYRKLVDKESPSKDTLRKVFNRTYTQGFMNGEDSSTITNIERPNNYGYPIGKVVKINNNKIWIRLSETINKGDQLRVESPNIFDEISIPLTKFFNANFKEVKSENKVAIVPLNKKVNLGAIVYKTKDSIFVEEANKSLLKSEYKKLPIKAKFTAKVGEKPYLEIIYKDFEVQVTSDFIVQEALTRATSKENISTQLTKLNDTPYEISSLEINCDENIFISLKIINELRRDAIAKLNKLRLDISIVRTTPKKIIPKTYQEHEPIITVQVANEEQYNIAQKLGIQHIYYKNIVRRNNEHYVSPSDEILIGGLGAINHYKKSECTLVGDYSLNVSNHISAGLLSSLGVDRITLSQEINRDNINKLVSNYVDEFHTFPNLELIVYGRTTAMHTKYCPLKRLNMCGECKKHRYALKDKFASFPLIFNNDCTIQILNSKALNIMDDLYNLKGVNYYRLVFTTETPSEVKDILASFIAKLSGEDIKLFDPLKHTRGHFIKNPL